MRSANEMLMQLIRTDCRGFYGQDSDGRAVGLWGWILGIRTVPGGIELRILKRSGRIQSLLWRMHHTAVNAVWSDARVHRLKISHDRETK